jgi:hypothetical protein
MHLPASRFFATSPGRAALLLGAALAAGALPGGAFLAGAGEVRAADEVTIYRCVDAKGRLTLRDTPCAKGEQQQARTMLRPKDAPPPPRTVERDAPPPPAPATPSVVYAYPPRPLYECITPDGERYTSDTAEGNPRWVPLWTLGYPVAPVYPRRDAGVDFSIGNRHVVVAGGSHLRSGPVYPIAAHGGAGSWIRDACHALPQAEVCDRVRERRDELRRRYFNAQPSERDVLRVEERGLNARLDSDCGGR